MKVTVDGLKIIISDDGTPLPADAKLELGGTSYELQLVRQKRSEPKDLDLTSNQMVEATENFFSQSGHSSKPSPFLKGATPSLKDTLK
jgi:hypothetical protein